MRVPLVDLQAQYSTIKEELRESVLRVLDSQHYIQGPEVEAFEQEFAAACETPYAIAASSGTAALHLALAALGIGPGDEVVTVSHTFIATAESISDTGATPVFVDIDPATYLMDPARLEAAITPHTRAIVPVHLYGQMADMDALIAIGARYGIPVIEDACQAHGASYRGRRAGSIGLAGCFSFYPSKNLGAIGEAGAIVTSSPELATAMRTLREHGQSERYIHDVVGFNYRMAEIQAAALRVKLPYLTHWNACRRAHARRYNQALSRLPLVTPFEEATGDAVYHLYVVRVEDREAFRASLATQGIDTGVHYPVPVHLQRAYAALGYRPGALPITEAHAQQIVSLPMYAELTDAQIDAVVSAITHALEDAQPFAVPVGFATAQVV